MLVWHFLSLSSHELTFLRVILLTVILHWHEISIKEAVESRYNFKRISTGDLSVIDNQTQLKRISLCIEHAIFFRMVTCNYIVWFLLDLILIKRNVNYREKKNDFFLLSAEKQLWSWLEFILIFYFSESAEVLILREWFDSTLDTLLSLD